MLNKGKQLNKSAVRKGKSSIAKVWGGTCALCRHH